MFANYIKIAWRNLVKHRSFAFLNILCLVLGFTFCLLIGAYIFKEVKVNSDLKNVSQQYLLKSNWKIKDMGLDITTLGPLAKVLRDEYPDLVKNYYRYNPVTNVVSSGDKYFKEDIAIGDTTFIKMYGFPLVYGNREAPFSNNSSAVITASMAKKLFGTENAIGKPIQIETTLKDTAQTYTVSAVVKDIPYNSVTSLLGDNYQVFLPTEGNRYYANMIDPASSWDQYFEIGFIELQPHANVGQVNKVISDLLKKYTPDIVQKSLSVELTSVKDYYLQQGSKIQMLWSLGLIAIFILIMGIVNYININIGVSSRRLKEIGLRKVFGSGKKQLVIQFMIESVVIAVVAGAISLTGYELLRNYISGLLGTTIQHIWQYDPVFFVYVIALILTVAIIAGIYPALVLSSSKIRLAVKGKLDNARSGSLQRKLLIGLQFTLAMIVFIVAITVARQMKYTLNKDLGYNKDQLLVITAFPKQWDADGIKKMENIKAGLKTLSIVKDASLSFEVPDRKPPNAIELVNIGTAAKRVFLPMTLADKDYASTFGMQMVTGAFFEQGTSFIPNQMVINEAALKPLELTAANAIGKKIAVQDGTTVTICGVVKDYNYSSLQDKIEPVGFLNVSDNLGYRFLSVKLKTGDVVTALEQIRNKWKELNPKAPFEYTFMDDRFSALYQTEEQLKNATSLATLLNMVIIFLGVFGVVAFTLAKREKEIAIRQVLGANVRSIAQLIVKDYLVVVLIAAIISWPIAYWIADEWLMGYAYRIHQSVLDYLLVTMAVLLIVLALVVMQTHKAAVANPIKSLRSE